MDYKINSILRYTLKISIASILYAIIWGEATSTLFSKWTGLSLGVLRFPFLTTKASFLSKRYFIHNPLIEVLNWCSHGTSWDF